MRRVLGLAVGTAWVLWILGFFAILLADPWAPVDDDENYAAIHAELLAGGLAPAEVEWQLIPACGGCRVQTAGGWALFTLLPPRLWTWKLLPLGFGLLGILAAALAGLRLGGPRAGALAALLVGLAPPLYRHLGQSGHGNHFEVSALLVLLVGHSPGALWGRRGLAWGAGAALVASFAYSAAPAVMVLSAVALLRGQARAIGAGMALGSLPWLALRVTGAEAWFAVYGGAEGVHEGVFAWLRALGTPLARALWSPAGVDVGLLGWAALLAVPLGLLVLARRGAGAAVGAAIVAQLSAFVLLGGRFPNHVPLALSEPSQWRYLAPVFPLLAVGAAALAPGRGRLARAPALVLLLLGAVGLVGDVHQSRFSARPLHLLGARITAGANIGRALPNLALEPPPSTVPFHRPLARRQALYHLGRALAYQQRSRPPPHPGWWARLDELEGAERHAALFGLAQIHGEFEGASLSGAGRAPPELIAALDVYAPAPLGAEAARAWERQTWGFGAEASLLARLEPAPGTWLDGYHAGCRLADARADASAGWLRGWAEGWGARRGYRDAAPPELPVGLSQGERAQALAGWRLAREWVFAPDR